MMPEKFKPALLEKAKEFMPGLIGFGKKGNRSEIVSFGPRWGESKISKEDNLGLLKSFERKKIKHF